VLTESHDPHIWLLPDAVMGTCLLPHWEHFLER